MKQQSFLNSYINLRKTGEKLLKEFILKHKNANHKFIHIHIKCKRYSRKHGVVECHLNHLTFDGLIYAKHPIYTDIKPIHYNELHPLYFFDMLDYLNIRNKS